MKNTRINAVLHLTYLKKDLDISLNEIPKNLKIHWHGKIDKERLDKIYSKIEFFVFPSLKESFGLPLIEHLICSIFNFSFIGRVNFLIYFSLLSFVSFNFFEILK